MATKTKERNLAPVPDDNQVPGNSQVSVQLGNTTYQVVPQRIGYLQAKLGPVIDKLMSSNITEGQSIIEALGGGIHTALSVFIPDLMPEWEFRGYGTPEAFKKKKYDVEADRSPTTDQIYCAVGVVLKLNRLDLIGQLKNVISPDLIRALMSQAIVDRAIK